MKKKVFPKLFAQSSDGRQKEWSISVHEQKGGVCLIRRTHGFTDCKMQTTDKPVKSGKNLGKKNETTIYEQAVFDAKSLWNKKKDRSYKEKGSKSSSKNENDMSIPLPMLALDFKKRKHNIEYPAYAQPKLNGVRCFATRIDKTTIRYTSRNGKVFENLDHLNPTLLKKMKVGEILDGEIYVHGMTFQQIIRLVKKWRPETKDLEYHIYDTGNADLPFHKRLKWVNDNLSIKTLARKVNTVEIRTEQDVYDRHDEFVKEGYEGVIVRNREGMYKFTHRSKDLQKYKEFFDEEFVIIGGKCATGIHKGCVIFICDVGNGETVDVYPRGSLKMRRQMYKDLDKYIGKELTVRYQEKSEDGVPIFPVGIAVRDYE